MGKLTKTEYVDQAEKVILSLGKNKWGAYQLTTNKIRNLLALTTELYNSVQHITQEKLSVDIQSRVQYTKMRFAYEAGRDGGVKDLVNKADLLNHLDRVGSSRESLILFCHYMEALVAYHRFYDTSK